MGRSKGDAGAARGKYRPASSSHAAAAVALPSAGAPVGFGGFVGSVRAAEAAPPPGDGEPHAAVAAAAAAAGDVDGDAFLHLKRLSKKDPTTKLKALAALTALFEARPAGEVTLLLPPWVFEYKRLVLDARRQVRQSAHAAMGALAACVGRGLAPHLRSVMGPWWVAQFDQSREVAEAAKAAFQVAFPGEKRRLEALLFCHAEIIGHIDENLKLGPEAFTNGATPKEELAEKHEHVVSCSLVALAALVDALVGSESTGLGQADDGGVAAEAREKVGEEAKVLYRDHDFLQGFYKSKSPRVRAANFQASRAFIQHLPEVFKKGDLNVLMPLTSGALLEKDSTCHQPMWDMLLLFMKRFPQALGPGVIKKTLCPRLWTFLRQGCYGSQEISYPYLLPLISLLPPSAIVPAQNFFLEFFRSLWQGRTAPRLGPADRVALLKAMKECLVWTVMNSKRFSEEGNEEGSLPAALIDGVLIKLLWGEYLGRDPAQESTTALNSRQSSNFPDPASVITGKSSLASVAPLGRRTQELGSCIMHILQLLSETRDDVLRPFWDEFQDFCFKTVQEAGRRWPSVKEVDPNLARVKEFFLLLGSKTTEEQDEEQWSLVHAVRPFVARTYPSIRAKADPESVGLLAKLTLMYGPTVFSLLTLGGSLRTENIPRQQNQASGDGGDLLQYFKEELVPWCLHCTEVLNAATAELLLAFLQSKSFRAQWDYVISSLTNWRKEKGSGVDIKQVGLLATILENIRERTKPSPISRYRKGGGDAVGNDTWKSQILDEAALTVASSNHLCHPECVRFLKSAFGVSDSELNVWSAISARAAISILQVYLSRLLIALSVSAASRIGFRSAVMKGLEESGSIDRSEVEEATEDNLQLATSALDILQSCRFSILFLDSERIVVWKLLAVVFCLKWACSESEAGASREELFSGDEFDTELGSDDEEEGIDSDVEGVLDSEIFNKLQISSDMQERIANEGSVDEPAESRLNLRKAIFSTWDQMSPLLLSILSILTRSRLRQVLISVLRAAVLDENAEAPQRTARRCAAWAREVVEHACANQYEVSEFMDGLVASDGDCWPRWVGLSCHGDEPAGRVSQYAQLVFSETMTHRHDRLAAFVDHLCKILNPQEVFLSSQIAPPGSETGMDSQAKDGADSSRDSCRVWLVVEMLCTWQWPGGNAQQCVLPYVLSLSRSLNHRVEYDVVFGTIQRLFTGSSRSIAATRPHPSSGAAVAEGSMSREEPFCRALLVLLKSLLETEDGCGKVDPRVLFREYVVSPPAANFESPTCGIQILPSVLGILMPFLRKRVANPTESDEEWQFFLETVVSVWLQKAMSQPSLVVPGEDSEVSEQQWLPVVIACFPLNTAGGTAAMAIASSASVTSQERNLLLALFRKQFSETLSPFVAGDLIPASTGSDYKRETRPAEEVALAKLVAIAIGYCWSEFGTEEWTFILLKMRRWLQEFVVEVEEFTETVVDAVKESSANAELDDTASIAMLLESVVVESRINSVELSSTAVTIFSLLRSLNTVSALTSAHTEMTLDAANWKSIEMRALEDVLRSLLAIGLAESAAGSSGAGEKGAKVVASQTAFQSQLWDRVADVALSASSQAQEAAIRAVELWGVGKGAMSALFALLFSPQPTVSLQWAVCRFLNTHQILRMAVTYGVVSGESDSKTGTDGIDEGEVKCEAVDGQDSQQTSPALVAQIRPELASVLETAHASITQTPLISPLRVSYLLGWSLLLTYLHSVTTLSPTGQRLVQYVQDSDIAATLLDCLFQHIPLERVSGMPGSRRKKSAAGTNTSSAAGQAVTAAMIGSATMAVEGLWPVQKESMVGLAGAVYGLMLLVLPACVRIWFTGLRDKSLAAAVEAFTATHCSPALLADEFSKVQATAVDEENLSIRSNHSLREVTAIYKKEEACMDIIIRIPSCYPLHAVHVECTRRVGINDSLLRKWILSMAAFLRNQNGALAAAVHMWKKNVDREFEGVEECPICYSIIHTSNHSLPRLACKTCRHKFHSACLYRWFSTSNQSTCPLCKSPF